MWERVLKMLGWRQTVRTAQVEEPAFHVPPREVAEDCAPVPPPQLRVAGGSNNLQVGQAGGDVISHVSRHTHHHVTIIQAPPQASANEPQARKPSSTEHSAVLRRMDQLRDRVPVLDFMEREFGTRMVVHLKSEQLFRLNRYLDVVLRNPLAKTTKTAPSRTRLKQGAHR